MTLALLLTAVTGAWAQYTITFSANGKTKTVENVTLPKTFQCSYNNADGELDLILKELYGWTGNANQDFCDGETTPTSSDENKVVAGSDNGDHYITINNVFEGTVTITGYYVVNSVVIETPYSLEISIAAPAPSGPKVAWDKASKTGTFTMPGGNVTVSVEYYDLATLADQGLTAAEDAAAKTEAPLAVLAENAVTGGTLMYFVIYDENFSQADAIALSEDEWDAAIPTAETIDEAGTYYVWYYIKGDDEHSDTDPQRLAVTVLPEPTYTVEFAEGTNNAPNKWTATPNPAKKGQQVTVTYEGPRKVMGVKAEKKAKAEKTITIGTQNYTVLDGETWKQFITRNQLSGWSVARYTDTTWYVYKNKPSYKLRVRSDGNNWETLELTSEDAPIDTDKQYTMGL